MKFIYSLLALSIISLTACDKAEKAPDTAQQEQVAPDTQSPKAENETVSEPNEPAEKVQGETNSNVASLNEGDYFDLTTLNESPDEFFAYVSVAQAIKYGKQFSDEDLLRNFSAEYRNESNSFKKQEIANKILPEIKENIAQHSREYVFHIPFEEKQKTNGSSKYNEIRINQDITDKIEVRLEPPRINDHYDFDKKGFSINDFESADIGSFYKTNSLNAPIEQTEGDSKWLSVTDEESARRLEELYNEGYQSNLGRRGYIDLQVILSQMVPMRASVEFFDMTTGKTLAKKDLVWSNVDMTDKVVR